MKRREAREILFCLIYEAGFEYGLAKQTADTVANTDEAAIADTAEDMVTVTAVDTAENADAVAVAADDSAASESAAADTDTGKRPLEEIYRYGMECREFEDDPYIRDIFFNIWNKLPEIDELIAECSVGWKQERLSMVSKAIMRLCVYEMLKRDDVPFNIAINEAVELAKKYDHDSAPKFINGVVNAVADKKGLKK